MRTTIVLPDYIHERVRRLAIERRQSMGEVIRQAVEKALDEARPKPKSIGIGSSGHTDLSERVEELYEPDPWR